MSKIMCYDIKYVLNIILKDYLYSRYDGILSYLNLKYLKYGRNDWYFSLLKNV